MFSPKVLEILEELRENSDLAIVEGKRDKKVLEQLGFQNIITISGKSLEEIVEMVISFKSLEVAILTDFDDEGEKITSRLTDLFSHHKIKVNHLIRKKLKSLKIYKIEELKFFTKLMGDDQNGKISSIYYKIFNRSRVFSRRNRRETRCYRCNIWPDRRIVGSRLGFEGTSKNR